MLLIFITLIIISSMFLMYLYFSKNPEAKAESFLQTICNIFTWLFVDDSQINIPNPEIAICDLEQIQFFLNRIGVYNDVTLQNMWTDHGVTTLEINASGINHKYQGLEKKQLHRIMAQRTEKFYQQYLHLFGVPVCIFRLMDFSYSMQIPINVFGWEYLMAQQSQNSNQFFGPSANSTGLQDQASNPYEDPDITPNKMCLGYYRDEHDLKTPCLVNMIKKQCHLLLSGKSGSGKSFAAQYYIQNALTAGYNIFIADFKGGEEYSAFVGSDHYSSGDEAITMINRFYALYQNIRTSGTIPDVHQILLIEEFSSLLLYLETSESKKSRDSLQKKVAELLAIGRGLNLGIWILVQRPDASLFPNGAREQFQIIVALGRLSKEQQLMLFAGEDIDSSNFATGEGFVLIDGQPLEEIMIPIINLPEISESSRKMMDALPALKKIDSAL